MRFKGGAWEEGGVGDAFLTVRNVCVCVLFLLFSYFETGRYNRSRVEDVLTPLPPSLFRSTTNYTQTHCSSSLA